jgi:hypothetical protein
VEKYLSNNRDWALLHPTSSWHTKRGQDAMKSFLWLVGGFCAASVGFLVWGPKRVKPVQELAKRLEVAWGDHHTVI